MANSTPGLWHFLTRKRGNRHADLYLWVTGATAALAIPLALLLPATIPLIWLVVVGLPVTGPFGPFLPTGFESMVMEVAKHADLLPVALAGTAVFVYTEVLNWYLFRWLLNLDKLAPLRKQPWMQRFVRIFARFPFVAVVLGAATPIPFWAVRVLAIYHGFSLRWHLLATGIGRFPRILFYAWVGFTFQPPLWLLLSLLGGGLVTALFLRHRQARRANSAESPIPTPAAAPAE